MSRTTALLIRHGDYHQRPNTPSALQPYPLTEEGKTQAHACIALIQDILQQTGAQLDPVIDTSQALRAWQTAQIIAEGLIPVQEVRSFDGLAERNLGCAANLTVAEIESILAQDPRYDSPPADWKSNSHYCLPLQGAESLLRAGQRVADHIVQRLTPETDHPKIKLFVAHGASFRHAAYHLDVLSFGDIARFSMHHARPVGLSLDQKGQWYHSHGAWKIRQPKDTPLD